MNYNRRHNYYVARTINWLGVLGYHALKVETNFCIQIKGRTIYTKRDLWGADALYRSASAIGLCQVKTSAAQIRDGVNQLTADPDWPPEVGRFVIFWPKGRRLDVGPDIYEVQQPDTGANRPNHFPKKPSGTYIAHTGKAGAIKV